MQRPKPDEYAPYAKMYVDLVPGSDLLGQLEQQLHATTALLEPLSEQRGLFRYAEGKWSVKELVGHLVDTERVFSYRAMRFGRADPTELPSFDQDVCVRGANFDAQRLADLVQEYRCLRQATLLLYGGFDAEALLRTGIASGHRASVRGIGFAIAGHELHHLGVLRERYGIG